MRLSPRSSGLRTTVTASNGSHGQRDSSIRCTYARTSRPRITITRSSSPRPLSSALPTERRPLFLSHAIKRKRYRLASAVSTTPFRRTSPTRSSDERGAIWIRIPLAPPLPNRAMERGKDGTASTRRQSTSGLNSRYPGSRNRGYSVELRRALTMAGQYLLHDTLADLDDALACHLPHPAAHRTCGREWEGKPPSEWSEPSRRKVEHGSLAVPPSNYELQASGHNPHSGSEFHGERRSDCRELAVWIETKESESH